MLASYLRASLSIESKDVRIREAAQQIVGPITEPITQVSELVEWLQRNISKEPVDVFSALDVLIGKKAECQGHALLYTALARALGIPSKVVNGLIYSAERQGFLYHSWAESYVAGTWIPIDPVFDTLIVDATHIKLLEGETPADCLPLIEMVGKLRSRILSFTHP
jgi:transglutaminase-like putative cysteine protease